MKKQRQEDHEFEAIPSWIWAEVVVKLVGSLPRLYRALTYTS